MPQVGGAGSDDLASSDEIKVFDDEGEKEEENRAISDLNDLKSSLITEGEQVCPKHFCFHLTTTITYTSITSVSFQILNFYSLKLRYRLV